MNKKIIKYLIWIILIAATIILMPTKETMASLSDILNNGSGGITYNYFKTSHQLFCLNKGNPYGTEETFAKNSFSMQEAGIVDGNKKVIEYIVTESVSGNWAGYSKTNLDSYIPQIAIWKLTGTNLTNDSATELINRGYAYSEFPSSAPKPKIVKEDANHFAVYYTKTTYGNVAYSNLISVTGSGFGDTYTDKILSNTTDGYTHKRVYEKNSGVSQVEVYVNYENGRNAELAVLKSTGAEKTISYIYDGDNKVFTEIGGNYYCARCENYQDPLSAFHFKNGSVEIVGKRCNVRHAVAFDFDFDMNPVLIINGGHYTIWKNEGNTTTGIKKTEATTRRPQNLLYGSGSITYGDVSKTIKFGVNLTINKTDSLTGAIMPGTSFRIDFGNVSSIDGYSGGTSTVYVTTDNNGQIKLTGILPADENYPITATITETGVPAANGWYYLVNSNPTTISMTLANPNVSVGITNQPYIDLSGNVWEDSQLGAKDIAEANGLKESTENNLAGIIVELYSVKDGRVIANTTTDSNGNYAFNQIPRTLEGFIVIFKYNGITYVETPYETVSKPAEVNRATFNNRFKTISKDKSNDGTELKYTYNDGKSVLSNTTIQGHTVGTTDAKFQMSAQTAAYNTTAYDVNCGLVKKNFDIALGTDVKSATIKINGKTTEYTYAEIMNGALNGQFDEISSNTKRENNEDIIYNLYLYSSDYNYRIDDYKTDIGTNNVVNPEKPEAGYTETEGDSNTDRIKEIEAYVTYSVILKSQTTEAVTKTSTVEQFVYYYDDSVYSPIFAVNDIVDGYKVVAMQGNKITLESVDSSNALTSGNDYRKEVNLIFKVKENGDQIVTIRDNVTNIAEITEYSTSEGGLIDRDSAPENGIANGEIRQYEDDTDEAKGLNIVLRNDETRAIVGTVFADTDKNGNNTNGTNEDGTVKHNEGVNDVIVQLIEIKKISGKYYEYIWQETRSGSNEVKTTARNGYTGTTYTNSVTEAGKYEFKDFIPGNYIIRYIYGDGTTYDVTDNVKTYNGQDYKSTKDPNYKKPWYNTAGYTAGDSIARDNEARRLEVMTYSTTINGTNGAHLANKTDLALEKTWMCAETSRINIPVDDVDDAKIKTAENKTDSTTAPYSYTDENKKVLFGDMNFGLALRPQENIVLEKHITALKITPTGTGVQSIVDAKAESIESIVNGPEGEVKVEGLTEGLATIKSTPSERGFWQVATDVEELMQGAELEVEYTYVIRNDSEENYLSNTLIQAYENQDIKPYNSTLDEIVNNTIKPSMKNGTYSYSNNNAIGTYLGDFYYTEDAESARENDKLQLVSARVERFEEALNNDLAFDETEVTSFKTARQASKENVYGVDKVDGTRETEINTVVENTTVSEYLTPKLDEDYTTETADWSKTITLRTTLSTVGSGELGANLPSYIAEVLQYSNAAGRKDMGATPENLGYVHSDDTTMTIERDNEQDEFWAESIIITKPTGEDKLTPIQIVLITISAIAVLGVGTVLIKKYVLKK